MLISDEASISASRLAAEIIATATDHGLTRLSRLAVTAITDRRPPTPADTLAR